MGQAALVGRRQNMSEPKQIPRRCEFEMEKLVLKLEEVVASDVSAIDGVVDRITGLIEQRGCAGDDLDNIELALREALANAILHGSRACPTMAVRVCVALQADCGMLIVVKDAGSGFNPSQLPNPVMGQNLFAEHGRGIFLINQLMDEVWFDFHQGTAIYMRRTAASQPREPK
jgi:serine/threonine-protein kinase RsbW